VSSNGGPKIKIAGSSGMRQQLFDVTVKRRRLIRIIAYIFREARSACSFPALRQLARSKPPRKHLTHRAEPKIFGSAIRNFFLPESAVLSSGQIVFPIFWPTEPAPEKNLLVLSPVVDAAFASPAPPFAQATVSQIRGRRYRVKCIPYRVRLLLVLPPREIAQT